eukprot:NODE_114_length_19305_cov_0.149849.p8 type:complete len:291 gc:universal NODE_114_length_19305_cov_0.149849:9308-10180(+)
MGLVESRLLWLAKNTKFNRYPLLINKECGKSIAKILEGPDRRNIVNLTAGLCFIEENLSQKPLHVFEPGSMALYKEFEGEKLDYLKAETNVYFETLNLPKETAIFASVGGSLFTLAITMWLKLMCLNRSLWLSHPLSIYILTETNLALQLKKGPGERGYSRISILSQCASDAEILLTLPSGSILGFSKGASLVKVTPKNNGLQDIALFNYMLKYILVNKNMLLYKAIEYSAANSGIDFRNSKIYDYKTPRGLLKNLKVAEIMPLEYELIFNEWKTWPCVKNGLLRDFNKE